MPDLSWKVNPRIWNIQYQHNMEHFDSFDVCPNSTNEIMICLSSLLLSSVDWYLDYSFKDKAYKYFGKFDLTLVQI